MSNRDLEVMLKAQIDNDRDCTGKAGMLEMAWQELPLFEAPRFAKCADLQVACVLVELTSALGSAASGLLRDPTQEREQDAYTRQANNCDPKPF